MSIDETIKLLSMQIADARTLGESVHSSDDSPNGQLSFIDTKEIEELFCNCGIRIKNSNGTYRNFYDVLSDMSRVWYELRDVGKDD